MHIKGYDAIVCTDDAERPAGGVGIYVKLPETAEDLQLPLTNQSHNGEHAAVKLSNGIVVMAVYLAPNLSKGDVITYIEKAMHRYRTEFKHGPFVLVGDFNVDIMAVDDCWLVSHMMSRYGLWCSSYDHKRPTTIRGTCIDIAFSNFQLQPLIQDPLATYFTDHKILIFKGKRVPQLCNQ